MNELNQEQDIDFEILEGDPGEITLPDYEDNDLPLVDGVRERRREERQQRKQRRTQAIERDKTELNFLRTRNDSLEKRLMGVEDRARQQDLHMLDKTLQDAQTEVQAAERVMSQAWDNQNGEEATQALKFRDQAAQKVQQLQELKQRTAQQQQSKPTAPPEVVSYAQEFMKDHPWYSPTAGDEDSLIVHALDASVARAGKDPRTRDYWDELRYKVSQRLPNRVNIQESPQRGGPVISNNRDYVASSSKQEVYISPERKAAMIEAGAWDDPVLRKRYVQRYMAYDREHQLNNRR